MTLEDEFRQIVADHKKEITDALACAEEELGNACKLSEKYGIPFDSDISFLSQPYIPMSFKKYKDLNDDLTVDLLDFDPTGYDTGWQHSMVCPN